MSSGCGANLRLRKKNVQVLVSVTGMTLGATVTTGTVGATTGGVTTVTVMTTAAVTTGEF